MDNTDKKIIKYIEEALNLEEPITDYNVTFRDDLRADSVDMITMLILLEEELDITIEEEEAEQFNTVNDVIEYVRALNK